MSELNALFTVSSLLSLQGAAAAALLVPAVLMNLFGAGFKPYAKWVSFVIAMLLAYLVALLAGPIQDVPERLQWIKWVIAFFNGFLIFAAAVGINEASAAGTVRRASGVGNIFRTWF